MKKALLLQVTREVGDENSTVTTSYAEVGMKKALLLQVTRASARRHVRGQARVLFESGGDREIRTLVPV